MFCRYCGESISTDAVCPACGRQLGIDAHTQLQRKEQKCTGVFSLMMMVLMLCWGSVEPLWKVLIYNGPFQIRTIIPIVILAAALVLLILLIARGLLPPRVYGLSDLLTILVLWQVLPNRLDVWFFRIYNNLARWSSAVMDILALPVFQFENIWLMLGLILLGLERQKRWRPAKKHWMGLAVFLALRTILSAVFAHPLLTASIPLEDIIQIGTDTIRLWSMFSWLLPVSILLIFHCWGSGKIGWIGAMLALCATKLGEVLLVPVLLGGLNMGEAGYGVVLGLAPLFSFAVLATAVWIGKMQQRTESTPQMVDECKQNGTRH